MPRCGLVPSRDKLAPTVETSNRMPARDVGASRSAHTRKPYFRNLVRFKDLRGILRRSMRVSLSSRFHSICSPFSICFVSTTAVRKFAVERVHFGRVIFSTFTVYPIFFHFGSILYCTFVHI